MELLALVVFNLFFGVLLYFVLSVKITNSVRDYQIVKLKKEIQTHTLHFFKESESYLALMDSRITIFKNLIQKAESMGVDFHAAEPIAPVEKKMVAEIKSDDLLKKFTEERNRILNIPESIPQNLPATPSKIKSPSPLPSASDGSGWVGEIGKVFRSILGIPDPREDREEMLSQGNAERVQSRPSKGIDFSVGGNPLLEAEYTDQNKENSPFQAFLDSQDSPKSPPPKDKITLSVKSSLTELPENAPKIDKVVHLLKKGFSHSQISEELGLAIPEISLIETIKLERNRRF